MIMIYENGNIFQQRKCKC